MPVIRAKFTDNQYRAITKYIEQHRMKNESNFIRQAVMTKIGIDFLNSEKNPGLPYEYEVVYYFAEDYKNTLRKRSAEAKRFDKFFDKWKIDYLTRDSIKSNKKYAELNQDAEAFLLAKKGRPKRARAPPGRKPDKGTDVENRTLPQ